MAVGGKQAPGLESRPPPPPKEAADRVNAATGERPGAGIWAVAEPRAVATFAVLPVLVVVVGKCALSFAFAGRYGWQRDELYYAVAGLHLQAGYVDFEPLTAFVSAAARGLFGWSLVGFHGF